MPPVASNAPATGDVDRGARPHTQDSAHAPNPDQTTGTTQPTEPTISPPATGRSTINADVCIVGAGPAGLAVLSALHAPLANLTDHESAQMTQA